MTGKNSPQISTGGTHGGASPTNSQLLKVSGLSVKIDNKQILDNVSFFLQKNEILAVNGPNGAGKSTLMRAVMGLLPYSGEVMLADKNIKEYKSRERAQKIAVVSQIQNRDFGFSVEEVVSFGRYSRRKGFFSAVSKEDSEAVQSSIELTGLKEYAERSITSLSGGELQRVYLAQALSQNPDILFLDEPTNNLDIGFQLSFFELIKDWVKKENKAVLAIVHDLQLCKIYADRALMLNGGKKITLGRPDEVFTKEVLEKVYNKKAAELFGVRG